MKKSPVPTKRMDALICLRVRPDLLAEFREAAEHQSLGLSAFVRMAAKSHAARVLKEKRRAA